MRRHLHLILGSGAILLTGLGTARAYDDVARTEVAGRCDAAAPLESLLRQNDNVEEIVNISCDRMIFGILPEVTGNPGETRTVAFLSERGYALRLDGRFGDTEGFTVETVRLGEDRPVPVSGRGRCRFYAEGERLRMTMCFAPFDRNGRKHAVVVAFSPR